jgi:hypothetical protein
MASRYTPRAAEYLPASQLSHAVLTPVVVLYFPAWQSSHAVLMPAKGLCFPATHSSQMAEPALAWYLPAVQLVQTVAPAIYTLLITHNSVQVFTSLYIKMTSVYQDEDVRACGQACVCVCQADTHLQQQRTSQRRSWCRQRSSSALSNPRTSQRRSWCRQRSSSALSNPRTSQRRSWCTEPSLRYMYTRYHTQLSASFYVSIYQDDLTASTRHQNYWHVCMHVCRYVHIYYAPSKSTHYFCHGKEMGKIKNIFPTSQERHTKCVRACGRYIRS